MKEQERERLAEARASKQRAEKRVRWGGRHAPHVDLEQLRRDAGIRADVVAITPADLAALLAVVDAARNGVLAWSEGAYADIDCASLEAALEPFTPPADRAWDRWHDAQQNPRDRARDQLADAGVMVQRQFRSDQERIAELETERDALGKELDARRADVRELETDAAASAGERGEMEERIAELERELEAERTRGIDHALYEMVCAERDGLEDRLARVPALVEALRMARDRVTPVGGTVDDILTKALAEWDQA